MTILGPCRCQGCGHLVFWTGIAWTEDGARHRCRAMQTPATRRLSPAQEAEARRLHGKDLASVAQLADRYGVTRRTVYRILARKARPSVEVEVAGRRATFELDEDGEPIKVTRWVAA